MSIQDEMIEEIMADDPALVRTFAVRATRQDVERWRALATESTNWANPTVEIDEHGMAYRLDVQPAMGSRDCTMRLGPYPFAPGADRPPEELLADGRFAVHARSMVLALCGEIERLRQVAVTQLCNQWEGLFAERAAAAARIQGLLEENARLGGDRTARGDMLDKLIENISDHWDTVPAGLLAQAAEYRDQLRAQREPQAPA